LAFRNRAADEKLALPWSTCSHVTDSVVHALYHAAATSQPGTPLMLFDLVPLTVTQTDPQTD